MTQQLLLEDFESALEFIRVQKIVNKLRNSGKVREYRDCMNHWLSSAPLKGARKGKLKRHLETCLAIQEIFDSIDNEGEGLELWAAPERRILERIFSAVEQYRFAKQKLHTTAGDAGILGELRQTEMRRRDVRNFCDHAALLVGQVAKHTRSFDQTEITDDALARAMGLAASTDLVMEIFNMYTYKNIPLSVGSKHLRVAVSTNTMEQALTWSTLRDRSYEIDRYHSINMQMEVLAAEVASSLGFMVSDFEPFMTSNTGQDLWKRSKFVATALEAISTAEVYSLVEPEISFTTRHGRFVVSELIRFWATLFQLAYCAYIWEKLTKRAEAPVVSNVGLKTLLSPANSTDQLEKLIEQFSLNPKLKNQDPFYRPIVKLDGTHSLLARTFIETGRFSRNLFTIAIAESDLDLSPKGLKPLKRLKKTFEKAGFTIRLNVPLRDKERSLTDVDIVAYKDGHLFLAQVKVLIQPDTLYEEWKARQSLSHAARQLRTCLGMIAQLRKEIGILPPIMSTVAFIVTNIWDFTGLSIDRFPVLDFSYVENLLTGARVGLGITMNKQPRRYMSSLIQGEFPTGQEFENLVRDPIHGKMFQHPTIERKRTTVAGWEIDFPVWRRDKKAES